MADMQVAKLRKDISRICTRVSEGRESFVIRRHSNPIMAIVPLDDLAALAKLEGAANITHPADPAGSISITDVRDKIAPICKRVIEERVSFVVTRQGTPVMALIPVQSYEAIEALERVLNALEAARALKEAKEKGILIPLEELRKQYRI